MKTIIIESIVEYLQEEKASNLNANFWKWFNGSKIVRDGNPLICYHGSKIPDIAEFDFTKVGYNTKNYGHYGYGAYFSTNLREAKHYGPYIYSCYLSIKKPFYGTEKQILELKKNGASNIDDLVILSIDFESFKNAFKSDPIVFNFLKSVQEKGLSETWDDIATSKDEFDSAQLDKFNDVGNMIEYTTLNKDVHGVPSFILDELKELKIKPKFNKGFEYEQSLHWITDLGNSSKEVTNIMKKLGYDGVWYGSEVIPFNGNQIKSISNEGTWNTISTNIYK